MRRSKKVAAAVASTFAGASLLVAVPAGASLAPVSTVVSSALQVQPLQTLVGGALAEAGPGGSSSKGTALTLLGQDIAVSEAVSNGSAQDSVAEVPVADGSVRVLPSEATASSNQAGSFAGAYGALADGRIPGLLRLGVLTGSAAAAWTPERSESYGVTEGLRVQTDDGSLVIVLLHAEGSGDGNGRLYVLGVNDVTVADSSDMDPINLVVPGLIDVTLLGLDAVGGSSATAQILQVLPLQDAGLAETLNAVAATAGAVAPVLTTQVLPARVDAVDAQVAGAAASGPALPATGAGLARLALLGAAMSVCGIAAAAARGLVTVRP